MMTIISQHRAFARKLTNRLSFIAEVVTIHANILTPIITMNYV